MRASTLAKTIKTMYPTRRTLCVEGAPGGGKTSIIRQAADALGVPYIEVATANKLVEDFGIPREANSKLVYTVPDWFPVKGEHPDEGILCFDDSNQCDQNLQKVIANIVQARTLHGHQMADVMVVRTGNRKSDRTGSNRVLPHLRNRETFFTLETHKDDCLSWALENNIHEAVIAYWNFRPGCIHDYNPDAEAFPSPRSWVEGVANIIGHCPPEAELEVFSGAIGEGAAAEFVGFMRIYRELPNPDAIIMYPKTADVPEDMATLYALSGALAARATPDNFGRVMQYLERLPSEFNVLTVSMAIKRDRLLQNTQAFIGWATKFNTYIF